jgi:hypothetical protein
MNNDNDNIYGDGYFLAQSDHALNDFRESDKETKRKIIEKMLTLRHNMQYNKHLQSVYVKAKGLFDVMVEEHRNQLYYLDEIYRHINQLIRENLSSISKKTDSHQTMMAELVKDKKRIGILLKKMRNSYEKLMNIDTVIGVTIDNMNEIMFMDDIEDRANKNDDDDSINADQDDFGGHDRDFEDIEEDDDEELHEQIVNIIKEDGCKMCIREYNQGKKKCQYCQFNFKPIENNDNDDDNDDDDDDDDDEDDDMYTDEEDEEDEDDEDDEDVELEEYDENNNNEILEEMNKDKDLGINDVVNTNHIEDEDEDEDVSDTSKSVILVY